MNKIQRSLIYAILLCLGIVGTVQADNEVNVKIDFALVQDAKGEAANKTAACIIVWVDGDSEEKVFCGYKLKKKESYLRDNTEVDKILSKRNKLIPATKTLFPTKVNGWLTEIEKGLSVKIASKSKIAKLFAEFVKEGVQEYSQYSGYDAALFKHTQPYDLVLPRQTVDFKKLSNRMFAFLAHNEVHRAVSKPASTSTPLKTSGPALSAPIKTLLANQEVLTSLSQPKIQAILKNKQLVNVLIGFNDTSAVQKRLTETSTPTPPNVTPPKTEPQTFIAISTNQIIMVILAIVIGVLVLIVVIFWTSGGSQDIMQDIKEINKIANDNLSRQIKAISKTSSQKKSPIDSESQKQLIAQITRIISQQITVEEIVTQVAYTVSEDTRKIKREIFNLITKENEKVEAERQDLKQQVATSEFSKNEAEKKLANTETELTQTKDELVEVKNRQDRMHKSLESLMLKRFRVIKPEEISIDELLDKLAKQGGTWQWYQQVLSLQYEASKKAMREVQALNNPQYDKIIKLLNIDNILLHSREFVTENPYFETDDKLLGRMQAISGGTWLSKVFRADDLFKTYFSDIKELKPLANRIAVTAMMLEAALEELGVEVIKPELLQKPSVKLPESAYKSTSNPLLMELTHDKVISKLSDKEPQLVVDIDKYGFATQDNPEPSMTILYADLGGWEGY